MEPAANQPPLIVIVGETASGKSKLAIQLAMQFNGEIVSADSRTLYKEFDIATAKPSPYERKMVPHHLIDIANPDRPITASDYKQLALDAINDIHSRGKLPFVVGGTGLYVDSLIYDFSFSGSPDLNLRSDLGKLNTEQLQARLKDKGIALPHNAKNPRHLIRQLETEGMQSNNHILRSNTLVIGLKVNQDTLLARIEDRINDMFSRGLEEEAKSIIEKYGPEGLASQTIGYREFIPYINGTSTIQDVRQSLAQDTLRYAKRQRTWFRRNKQIVYVCKVEECVDLITTFLNKVTVA